MAEPADFVPFAASAAEPSEPDSEYLQDNLQLQEIFLESLPGTSEDTPDRRAEIKAEIKNLRRQLRRNQAAKNGGHSNVSRTGHHGAHTGMPAMDGLSRDPRRRVQPGDDHSLKRTFSSANLGMGQLGQPEPKSRRTTPTSKSQSDDPFDDEASVIDLSEADENAAGWLASQRDEERRLQLRKVREEADAMLARRLHEQSDNASPGSEIPTMSSSRPDPSGEPELNAFDRIRGRYFPAQPHDTGQSSLPQAAGTVSGRGLSSTLPERPSPRRNIFQVYPHNLQGSGMPISVSRQTPPVPAQQEEPSGMPGSYINLDSDDEDDVYFTRPQANNARSVPNTTGLASTHSNPSSANPWSMDPAELARQAACSRQQGYMNSYGYNLGPGNQMNGEIRANPSDPIFSHNNSAGLANQPGVITPSMVFPSRPGSLTNGSANPFNGGFGPASAMPVHSQQGSGGSLSAVINRTAQYDLENGLDQFGNPLPEDVRHTLADLMQNDYSQDNLEEIRKLLTNIAPDMDIPEEDRVGTPLQLKYPLYPHQRVALTWMEQMEADPAKRGGILADDMGLGKTISTLALLVSRPAEQPADPTKRPIKTTIIVGPVALLRQWERELQTKIKSRYQFSVHNYHARKVDYETLRMHDIVLTSYGILAAEEKKIDDYTRECASNRRPMDNSHLTKICPFLSNKSVFHRIVLDEAQYIKNRKTAAAKAASRVQATYRWCLTGTPMMNSVDELASLVHFLRIRPYSDFTHFSRSFRALSRRNADGASSATAMRKLQGLLKLIMLRRTKKSELDGKPIIDLPPKIEEVNHVVFSPDEKEYYEELERDSQVKVNKFLSAVNKGAVGKKYLVALTLLLRLRQACCHPFLHMCDLEYANNEIPEEALIALANSLDSAVIKRIKEVDSFECPICYDVVQNPTIMLPCGHDTCSECLTRLTGSAEQHNMQAGQEGSTKTTCPECRGQIDTKKVITYDIFKKVHMPEENDKIKSRNDDSDDDEDDGDETDSGSETASDDEEEGEDVDENGDLRDFIVADDDVDEDDQDNANDEEDEDVLPDLLQAASAEKKGKTEGKKRKKSKKSRKARDKGKGKIKEKDPQVHELAELRKDAKKNMKSQERYMRYLTKIWQPSAKIDKCKELIADIQETGEKTIVFSQWTMLLDLLEIPIKNELGLGYRRYDGSMSAVHRDNAVRDFTERSSVKVMLISLKAGNAGLNLISASQVIILDPFWNPYVEMQAVDRAHRIGQMKPVKVHRILIEGTVEDRIIQLQEKKRELVDTALDESAARGFSRLSAQDFRFLFGLTSDRSGR